MSNLLNFNFGSSKVRVYEKGSNALFVASDVAKALGYSNLNEAVKRHCKGVVKQDTLTVGGIQQINLIPESDIYRLVFRSKLPEAEKFVEWVTSEVLPSIRKNGMYAIDELLDNPDLLIQTATRLKEAKAKIEADKPKVEMYDIAMKSDDLLTMEQVAKIVNKKGYGRNNLFAFLRDKKILQDDYNNTPYQSQVNNGRFEVKEIAYTTPKGIERIATKTLVTQKGLEYIIKLVDKDIKGSK